MASPKSHNQFFLFPLFEQIKQVDGKQRYWHQFFYSPRFVTMLSLQQQVLQVHDEIKEKHQIALDAIMEEAGNSSTGRVRLKEALEMEMRARMAAERQIKDLKVIVSQHDEKADKERLLLRKQLEQVELARASLQARVDKTEQEIRALKQYIGIEDYSPGTKSPPKYKNAPPERSRRMSLSYTGSTQSPRTGRLSKSQGSPLSRSGFQV
jgi:hypothetical protein